MKSPWETMGSEAGLPLPVLEPTQCFPPWVELRWHFVSEAQQRPLCPEEEGLISATAAPKVRELFRAARSSAHEALKVLDTEGRGWGDLPIGRGDDRRPLWPAGTLGSLTHTEGLAMAVVARQKECLGIGIDVEKCARRPNLALVDKLCGASERAWVEAVVDPEEQGWRLLRLLSAKEAVFKTFYPLDLVYFGFLEAELSEFSWRDSAVSPWAQALSFCGEYMGQTAVFKGHLCRDVGDIWPREKPFVVLQSAWKDYLVSACWVSCEASLSS